MKYILPPLAVILDFFWQEHKDISGFNGVLGTHAPVSPIPLISVHFLGKIWSNNRLVPPTSGVSAPFLASLPLPASGT